MQKLIAILVAATFAGFTLNVAAADKAAEKKADLIIRNTYRTLMTRGMKGCYVYCTDPAVAKYFREQLEKGNR
jgi:DUF2075 family protein